MPISSVSKVSLPPLIRTYLTFAVDREERPDIDQIYMTFVTAVSGHGGWPLNVFLTPDLEPIFGGTYFAGPETSGIGRPGFIDVLQNITRLWKNDQDRTKASGKHIIDQLKGFVHSFNWGGVDRVDFS